VKASLVDDLLCPISRDPLRVETDAAESDVEAGWLVCQGCGRNWTITGGVPRLVPPDLGEQQRETATAFGWQWQHFAEFHPQFEEQFLDWLYPIDRAFFEGKRVLDAGCGTGRHAFLAAGFGAREVVAVDLSGAVEAARANLAALDNVHVVQGDLLRLPLRPAESGGGFDLVYSIGVLHHLPDPHAGFRALLPYLRPGGTIAVWLYGYENNGLVRHAVEPLRRLTTRMPRSALRAVAWPLALGFHGIAKGVYRPLGGSRARSALPLDEYMTSVADFSFRQNYGIVFDQLSAPTAAYIRREDLEGWFAESGLTDVRISQRHGNSWRGSGRAPSRSVDRQAFS
jgi:SAM-dependent methyltransferase